MSFFSTLITRVGKNLSALLLRIHGIGRKLPFERYQLMNYQLAIAYFLASKTSVEKLSEAFWYHDILHTRFRTGDILYNLNTFLSESINRDRIREREFKYPKVYVKIGGESEKNQTKFEGHTLLEDNPEEGSARTTVSNSFIPIEPRQNHPRNHWKVCFSVCRLANKLGRG